MTLGTRLLPAALAALASAGLSLVAGCPEAPKVGRAADPASAQGPAPWGSATSNADLQKKVALLQAILDGKVTNENLKQRLEADYPDLTPEQRNKTAGAVATLLEDLNKSGLAGKKVPDGPQREMAMAQLYFSERRFIEAALILSTVLDKNPVEPGARNLLARCFFFLGNRDRTITELEFVLTNPAHQKDKDEILDALFLMGAAVAETPGMSRQNMERGKGAWETYLKLAPDTPQKEHVQKGLAEIEAGLRGEGRLAQAMVPIAAEGASSAPKNVMGGSASLQQGQGQPAPQGPGSTGQGPAERRVDKLTDQSPPFEVALAKGLDALDVKDLQTAETELKAALALQAASPDALTGLGRVYVQTGRIEEAQQSFGQAIKVAPNFAPAWHYNGMAKLMGGSPQEAVTSWQKVEEIDAAYFQKHNLGQRIEVAKRMQ